MWVTWICWVGTQTPPAVCRSLHLPPFPVGVFFSLPAVSLHLAGRVPAAFFTPGKPSSRGSPGPETPGAHPAHLVRGLGGVLAAWLPRHQEVRQPGTRVAVLSGRWGAPPPGVTPAAAGRGQGLSLQTSVSHAVSTSGLRGDAGLAPALTAATSLPGAPPGLPQVPFDLRGLRQEEDHT